MNKSETDAILSQLEAGAGAGCAPWRDTSDGSVWREGMQLAVQLSIAISLCSIAHSQKQIAMSMANMANYQELEGAERKAILAMQMGLTEDEDEEGAERKADAEPLSVRPETQAWANRVNADIQAIEAEARSPAAPLINRG